ncbi:MAG: hypothetical protein RSB82_01775 [Victivallaceae bacterium]
MIVSAMDVLVGCSIVVAFATTVLIGFALCLLISIKKTVNIVHKILNIFNLETKIMTPIILGKKIISTVLELKDDLLQLPKSDKKSHKKFSQALKYTAWIGLGLTLWGIFRKKK